MQTKINLLYPELSYELAGIAFYAQNKLGRFAKEKQYADLYEERMEWNKISFHREYIAGDTGNRPDVIAKDIILVEFKAAPFLKPRDFAQVQRYLPISDLELGILFNFSEKILKPHGILKLPPNVINRNS